MSYDVIVVGAGVGGLTAAATLAKNNLKVHLIESHDKVGGFATNYRRGKYRMEAGIHMMAGSHPQSLYKPIFDYFEIEKKLNLVQIPEFYQCHYANKKFTMPFKIENALRAFYDSFPDEKKGIDTFFKDMVEISNHFLEMIQRRPFISATHPMFHLIFNNKAHFWQMSIGQYLDLHFKNPELKIALLANMTFYHDQPYELSLIMYMICQINYIEGAGYYIQGGSQNFSDLMKNIILENGGQVTLNHRVRQLVHHGEEITEVHYHHVRKADELKSEKCRFVVFNGSRPQVYGQLIQEHNNTDSVITRDQKLGLSTSACTIYFGTERPLQDFGSEAYMNLVINAKAHHQDFQAYKESFGVINYDQIPTRLTNDSVYSCEVITMDHMKNWPNPKMDKESYLIKKQELLNNTIHKMDKVFPGFAQQILFSDVSTPYTVQRYTHSPEGAIYGYSPSPQSMLSRSNWFQINKGSQDENFKNLYYGSAWSFLPGFTGAMIGGHKAALELLAKT